MGQWRTILLTPSFVPATPEQLKIPDIIHGHNFNQFHQRCVVIRLSCRTPHKYFDEIRPSSWSMHGQVETFRPNRYLHHGQFLESPLQGLILEITPLLIAPALIKTPFCPYSSGTVRLDQHFAIFITFRNYRFSRVAVVRHVDCLALFVVDTCYQQKRGIFFLPSFSFHSQLHPDVLAPPSPNQLHISTYHS